MDKHTPPTVAGNYFDKYGSKNPLYQSMLQQFIGSAKDLLEPVSHAAVLEVGCGAGELAERLFGPPLAGEPYLGTDVSTLEIEKARHKYPGRRFEQASIYSLPFHDGQFDLVIACEVFEHLEDPLAGLREVRRVCKKTMLASVPWEPAWCLLNMARGKYWNDWGNTPGHVQHFSRNKFIKFIQTEFSIGTVKKPFPWTMVLAYPGKTDQG